MANMVHPCSKGVLKKSARKSLNAWLVALMEVGIKPAEICQSMNPCYRIGDYEFKLVFELHNKQCGKGNNSAAPISSGDRFDEQV